MATVNKRFRYVRDDDGHGYMIPAEMRAAFEKWQSNEGNGGPVDFNDYRLSHSIELYTFERVLRDR